MFDTIIHRWFKVPYRLHVEYHGRVKHPRATVVFLHGIGNTGESWRNVIEGLPKDIQAITIDLLGFGKSPKPSWATYDAKTQARGVLRSYFMSRRPGKVMIVGHSLGALTAVEMAKRYPLIIDSLVLCSPPFYDVSDSPSRLPKTDKMLRSLYQAALRYPDQFVRLVGFLTKYKLTNPSFNVTADNVGSYMAALETMIINQTSLEDARKLTIPTHILYGILDPVVVGKNIKALTKITPSVTAVPVLSGHEVTGRMVTATVKAIKERLPEAKKRNIINR
ncbi:MAG: alpha/beta fold hydrolase [Candidatus Saccharimonadales bacterium]